MIQRIRGSVGTAAFWLVSACAVLIPPTWEWLRSPPPFHLPMTPVDNVNYPYSRQWFLLEVAARSIPEGQTYTVIAGDLDSQMLLLMLSLGLLPGREPLPTSYWHATRGSEADRARFVVSLDCREPPGRNRLILRVAPGCVFERQGGLMSP